MDYTKQSETFIIHIPIREAEVLCVNGSHCLCQLVVCYCGFPRNEACSFNTPLFPFHWEYCQIHGLTKRANKRYL